MLDVVILISLLYLASYLDVQVEVIFDLLNCITGVIWVRVLHLYSFYFFS